MRTEKILFLLLLLCSTQLIFAGQHKVYGTVKERMSGAKMPDVSVYDTLGTEGTETNANGYYELMLPDGEHAIEVSFIGYKTITKKVVIRGKDEKLDFKMETEFEELDEIVVSRHKEDENVSQATIGIQHIDASSLKKLPSLMGEADVIKAIQLLPGVQSAAEGTSGFSVRGGKSDQNLILLDDASLYNASHMMGFFSIFNNDVVDEAILLKGDIPAQYGGRLSSVLKVQTKDAFPNRFKGAGGIGLISSRIMLDIPIISNKTGLIVAARRSYADLFLPLSNNESLKNTKLFFYDMNAKLSHKIDGRNRIFWSGYLGTDKMGLNNTFDLKFGNTNTALKWSHITRKSSSSDLSVIGTKYIYNIGVFLQPYECEIDAGTKDWSIIYDWKRTTANDNIVKAGVSSTFHRFNQGSLTTPQQSEYAQYNLFDETTLEIRKALEHGIYGSYEMNVSPRFILKAGLRLSMFQNIGNEMFYLMDENHKCIDTIQYEKGEIFNTMVNPEPRVGLLYKLTQSSSIKAAYTHTIQYAQVASNSTGGLPFDIWFPTSPNIKPQKCDQWSTGFFKNFSDNMFETSAEIFYKRMRGIIDFKDDASIYGNELIDADVRTGNGYAYGLELQLKKNSGKLTGWISYTYSRSRQKVEEINFGKEYNSPFDRPHNVTVILSYDFTKRLNISANWTFLSGQPCTNPYGKYTVENTSYAIYTGQRNQSNYPNYHRMDLSLTWKTKPKKRWESEWNLSCYNVYARHNTWAVMFTQGENNTIKTTKLYLFSIVPSISYNFKF